METELTSSGISLLGQMPWGTHFCYFYETQEDLLNTLVPYFQAGLENKEYCLWVISKSELLTVSQAQGFSMKEVALMLNISGKTVESHRLSLMRRLDIHDVPSLVRFAIRTGLVRLED